MLGVLALNVKTPAQARNLRHNYTRCKVVQLGNYKELIALEKKLKLDALAAQKAAFKKEP